jgi:hypothetical protein
MDGGFLIKNLGNNEETVGIVRGIPEHGGLGQALDDDIFPDHIKDGNGMGCRLDAGDVEFVHLLNMIEDAIELAPENICLFWRDFKAGKTGQIRDINGVIGRLSGSG